ncbi:unknown [Crocosphaera subtropica ATCC 51142]|uniref:Uncharacterized protein n=1 Tax=Crocosphaera subtropica (strain ATCC 51142 / BH68) TaxID=43989 RepID=B1WX02_CROS5|nr:sulfotransferase domain-containing protein [Crocosphaera subtropica]ACB52471.1 unknown [Crocosphaera subtropica ATCC 51142]
MQQKDNLKNMVQTNRKKKHHIILTNGRSGSNYLSNLLNLHPEITNYGEVLGDWTLPYKLYKLINYFSKSNISVSDYLDYILNSQKFFAIAQYYSAYSHFKKGQKINFKKLQSIKTVGIKDFSINFLKRGVNNYITERSNLYIINLYRENSLKRLISLEAMNITGVIASKETQRKNNSKIYLFTDNLIAKIELYEKEKQSQFELVKLSPKNKILEIKYEDYFLSYENQELYNQKIFDFLGVSKLNLVSQHKKILSQNLVDILKNYDEVVEIIQGTKYEKFLHD